MPVGKCRIAVLIEICGNVVDPSKFMPKSARRECLACLRIRHRRRVNPARCCQVSDGVKITVLSKDTTWLPAESCWAKPSE